MSGFHPHGNIDEILGKQKPRCHGSTCQSKLQDRHDKYHSKAKPRKNHGQHCKGHPKHCKSAQQCKEKHPAPHPNDLVQIFFSICGSPSIGAKQINRGKSLLLPGKPINKIIIPARNPKSSRAIPGKVVFVLMQSNFSIASPCTILRRLCFNYEKSQLFHAYAVSTAAVQNFHNKKPPPHFSYFMKNAEAVSLLFNVN